MTAHAVLATATALVLAGSPARPQPAPPASAAQSGEFDRLVSRADAAREAGRLDEASGLYRDALRLRPRWAPGWGHLGTMAYERDRFRECRDAFRRLVALEPASGPGWALEGLCEFGLQAYAASRRSLDQALERGGLPDATLLPVVLFHQALLRIRAAEYEAAIPPLTQLATASPETADLVAACGLLLLRRPLLPADVPPADRELVARSGRAYCAYLARRAGEARARFAELLASYPSQEHLHYGYGLFLAQQTDPEAASQFRKEIELHPGHVLAHLELAFELLRRGDAKGATTAARVAAKLAPGLFAAHLALGRALVGSGQLAAGIVELETAARLGPGVPETFRALANAYERVGRKLDAERARGTVRKLDKLDEARRARVVTEPAGPAKP